MQPSLSDVHVGPLVRWALRTLGVDQEPGFDAARFPRVHAWRVAPKPLPPSHSPTLPANSAPRLASLPDLQPAAVPPEEAAAAVLGAAYLEPEVDVAPEDPLGVEAGSRVAVESADDAAPGAHAQVGRLVGLGRGETVVELENGVRLHFPRAGYVVRRA